MVKLQFNKTSKAFFVTIPKDIILAKKWKAGINLLANYNEKGNVELREVE